MSNVKKTSSSYKRQPSGNRSRRSSQLKENPGNSGVQTMATPARKAYHDQARGHSQKGCTSRGASTSTMASENQNSFDSARISQWAAFSATGPSNFLGCGVQDQDSFSYGGNTVPSGISPQVSGGFSASSLDAFHTSAHCAPLQLQCDPGVSYIESSTTSAQSAYPKPFGDQGLSQGQELGRTSVYGDAYGNGLSSIMNSEPYPAFGAGDFLPLDPVDSYPPMVPGNNDINTGLTLPSSWEVPSVDLAQSFDWSPAAQITPSASSMQSSNSFLGHQPDTPVSGSLYDGIFTTGQDSQADGNNAIMPPLDLEGMMMNPSLMNYVDCESTIRPHQNFQRAPLPSMDMWPGYDVASPTYGASTGHNGFEGSRRSSDGEAKVPRDHVFYKATPKDGLYYCPYAATDNCTHKPEKLKCNYDKHLDSHLKPYRCKSFECSHIQFSSTACLLRHEREAHGMHGHGPKPHLCIYKDCERAQEDNGFPRRWNLFDHMKRVHDHAATEPSNKSNSPAPSSSSPEPHGDPPKKKRTPSPTTEGQNKRVKVNAASRSIETSSTNTQNRVKADIPAVEPGFPSHSLDQLWYDQRMQTQTRLQSLDPRNPRQWEQYQADDQTLRTIRLSMHVQQAQLAN